MLCIIGCFYDLIHFISYNRVTTTYAPMFYFIQLSCVRVCGNAIRSGCNEHKTPIFDSVFIKELNIYRNGNF